MTRKHRTGSCHPAGELLVLLYTYQINPLTAGLATTGVIISAQAASPTSRHQLAAQRCANANSTDGHGVYPQNITARKPDAHFDAHYRSLFT
jgi:hypothetical protein